MSKEEKYKLALFAVIRNNTIMPAGKKLGKSMKEINSMAALTMFSLLEQCDFDILKEDFEKAFE